MKRPALVEGRFIIGIDPAKERHDAVIVDPGGIPVGRSFSFSSPSRASATISGRISLQVPELAGLPRSELPERLIFAIENSCNHWINPADWVSASVMGTYEGRDGNLVGPCRPVGIEACPRTPERFCVIVAEW
jgi:hypothetical protein